MRRKIMSRAARAGALALLGLAVLGPSPVVLLVGAQQPDTVSLARIRHALEQAPTPGLALPIPRMPGDSKIGDFKVEVHEKKPNLEPTILDSLIYTPGPILSAPAMYPSSPALFEVKIPLAESLAAKARNALHARAERAAEAEAREALRQFCATHVCSTGP
jgi:hypothetical protein